MRSSLASLLCAFTLLAGAASSSAALVHRWSFNNAAGPAANGAQAVDSVGSAVATIRGNNATYTGAALRLQGTTTGLPATGSISAYVDLPNGIVSSRTNLTIEIWLTPHSFRSWARIFSFGSIETTGDGAPGEVTGASSTDLPAGLSARDELFLALTRGTTSGQQRAGWREAGVDRATVDTALSTSANTQYHYAFTYQAGVGNFATNGGRITLYRNGVLAGSQDVALRLSDLGDVNAWLGRANDPDDSQIDASYDEVRVYDTALTATQIAASWNRGANGTALPTTTNDAVTLHHGGSVRYQVTANDSGTADPSTVEIVSNPSSGTAVAQPGGHIYYRHTSGGTPASDSFTYRMRDIFGAWSAPATVQITFSTAFRIPATTLRLPAAPPTTAFSLVEAFPGMPNFVQPGLESVTARPLCLRTPPGETSRLFVVDRAGYIYLIPNVAAATASYTTFLNLPQVLATASNESMGTSSSQGEESGFLGLAFHPSYASNGRFFISYSVNKNGARYQRLAEFTVSGNPNLANHTSQRIFLEQRDDAGNHNGGDIHFGPDGYLYYSLGDEGNQDDSLNNSQRITKDFWSGIIRIDVDRLAGNLEPNPHTPSTHSPTSGDQSAIITDAGVARYKVPADNPFVGATSFIGSPITTPSKIRTEFWITGLRNPWRMSFDPPTGELWIGDVGGGQREEIIVGKKGENHGWAFREGFINGPKSGSAPANFDTLYGTRPLHDYDRGLGNSVTGGVVYRGARFPGLTGKYIFADYGSGRLWSLVRSGGAPVVTQLLTQNALSAFGHDPSNGDVLAANIGSGRILRLIENSSTTTSFPERLSDTGLFADVSTLSANPGLVPYTVNLPFWSNHATKQRWFAIPDASTVTYSRDANWTFPTGMVWVKHFDLALTRGNPGTNKRLETRVLVRNSTGAYGVSYKWNEAGTEAFLAPDAGDDFDLTVTENGAPRTQRWRIPGRGECIICHTPQAGHSLSFTSRQLNCSYDTGFGSGNQLTLLANGGYLTSFTEQPNTLPRHHRPEESAVSLETRARSYFAVNCGYCHFSGGTGTGAFDVRAHLSLAETGIINGNANNNGGSTQNKLIVPNDLTRSIIRNRIEVTNGFTRMPPIGVNETDHDAAAVIRSWILDGLDERTYAEWRLAKFGSSSSPAGDPGEDPDGDGILNRDEFLRLTLPLTPNVPSAPVAATPSGGQLTVQVPCPPDRRVIVEISTDLQIWSHWNVPGNDGAPSAAASVKTLQGPAPLPNAFLRTRISEQ